MGISFIAEDKIPEVKRNPWADNFFRPLLITIMIMCINLSLVNLVRLFNPSWSGAYFLIGMLLTTVEAIYSYRVLSSYRLRGISILRYRLAEGVVLIVMLKILNFADQPMTTVWTEIQAIWETPERFFTLEFYILLVLACIAWIMATNTVADFEALHDPYSFRSDNITPLDSLATRFFWGGGVLVLISGVTYWISRADLTSKIIFQPPAPNSSGIILNILVYFTLGLVLLSQANLTRLLMRWRTQQIAVAPSLVKQWAKYGLIFLGLITLVVFFLPTSYTLGFLASAGVIVRYLISMLLFILQLIIVLMMLPLTWLLSLFGVTLRETPAGPRQPPLLPELLQQGEPVPWLEALRSLIFWLLAGAIAWYLLKSYLNDHPELIRGLRSFKPVNWFIELMTQLWQRLMGLAQAGLDLLPRRRVISGQQHGSGLAAKRRRWAGLGGLSARERILYYYLNILQRATKHGAGRKWSQTPYEYEPELSQAAPDVQPAVNLLTQVFVRARYSQESFTDPQAALAKRMWQQIRRELRRKQEAREAERQDRGDS